MVALAPPGVMLHHQESIAIIFFYHYKIIVFVFTLSTSTVQDPSCILNWCLYWQWHKFAELWGIVNFVLRTCIRDTRWWFPKAQIYPFDEWYLGLSLCGASTEYHNLDNLGVDKAQVPGLGLSCTSAFPLCRRCGSQLSGTLYIQCVLLLKPKSACSVRSFFFLFIYPLEALLGALLSSFIPALRGAPSSHSYSPRIISMLICFLLTF